MMEGGMKGLFKGVTPTLARGYLVNMVTLPLFDAIKGKLEEWIPVKWRHNFLIFSCNFSLTINFCNC